MDGGKKIWGNNTSIRQNRLQTKSIKKDTEGHFIILNGRIHQEDISILNIYSLNREASKYTRKILEDFKKDKNSNTIILGDFNTPLSTIEDNVELIDTLDQMDLTEYIYIIYMYP